MRQCIITNASLYLLENCNLLNCKKEFFYYVLGAKGKFSLFQLFGNNAE